MKNPYLELLQTKFEKKTDDILDIDGFERENKDGKSRESLIQEYSFAIPDEDAIQTLVKYSPLIEIGAGSGYWAYLADSMGANIIAFDNMSRMYSEQWYTVQNQNSEISKEYPERTLFLCWPENKSKMGETAVRNYEGDTVILVGEHEGRCTGNDSLYSLLKSQYTLQKTQEIPNWYSIQDYLFIYTR